MIGFSRLIRMVSFALGIAVAMSWTIPAAMAQAVCQDPGSTMLWQVTGAALDSRGITVNLLGSIHVGRPDFYPLAPEIETRFKAADSLVFEVDPQTVNSPATAVMIQQRGALPEGQTLEQVLSPDTFSALNMTLTTLGIPPALVSRVRPWLVSLMLASFQVQALGYDAQFGIETYLMGRKPDDAKILELENIMSQVAVMESLNPEVFLRYSLLDFEQTTAQMSQMVDAWRCGDHDKLHDVMFAAASPTGEISAQDQVAIDELVQRIFNERNVTMANGIEQFIKTGSGAYFVTVGAGHLIGEGSVVDLLQQRGYTVTPVRKTP